MGFYSYVYMSSVLSTPGDAGVLSSRTLIVQAQDGEKREGGEGGGTSGGRRRRMSRTHTDTQREEELPRLVKM